MITKAIHRSFSLFTHKKVGQSLRVPGYRNIGFRNRQQFALQNYRFFSQVAHPGMGTFSIPRLKVIDAINEGIENSSELRHTLSKTLFVWFQHKLESTATIALPLLKNSKGIVLAGKYYSTSKLVEDKMREIGIDVIPDVYPRQPGQCGDVLRKGNYHLWQMVTDRLARDHEIEQLVICSDGSECIETMPDNIRFKRLAVIEQTRGGMYSRIPNTLLCPYIEVASSAVKKILEPKFIAEAAVSKVKLLLQKLKYDPRNTFYGVIGNGAIGSALIKYLVSTGCRVIIYDEDGETFQKVFSHNVYRVKSLEAVVANASVIFSCTGKDVTQQLDIDKIATRDKIFASCSSGDKEFLKVLKKIARENRQSYSDPFANVTYTTETGSRITFLNMGTPTNFDRTPQSVPTNDIAITRALLLLANLQAAECASTPVDDGYTINNASRVCVNPYLQRFAFNTWVQSRPSDEFPPYIHEQFNNIPWIMEHSGGEYLPSPLLEKLFSGPAHKLEDSFELPQLQLS